MSQTQIPSGPNGHVTAARDDAAARERRHPTGSPSVSPERLIERHVEDARRQLSDGRERLKQARRRVVQLEEALVNWERLAWDLRRGTHDTPLT